MKIQPARPDRACLLSTAATVDHLHTLHAGSAAAAPPAGWHCMRGPARTQRTKPAAAARTDEGREVFLSTTTASSSSTSPGLACWLAPLSLVLAPLYPGSLLQQGCLLCHQHLLSRHASGGSQLSNFTRNANQRPRNLMIICCHRRPAAVAWGPSAEHCCEALPQGP